MTQLSLVGVSKVFGSSKVVDNVSLNVEPGKVHVLLGENGAGKSTVIKMMGGVYQPDEEHIEIDGKQTRIPNVDGARKLGIAVIHQELNMVPELSIMENMFLGNLPTKAGFLDKQTMKQQAQKAVAQIGLDEDVSTPMRQLGVARQQMVEIAKALMQEASILILDEPTAALTDKECQQLFGIMGELKKKGVGMVLISHHLDEIEKSRRCGHGDARWEVCRHFTRFCARAYFGSSHGREKYRKPVSSTDFEARKSLAGSQRIDKTGKIKDVSFSVRAGEVVGMAGLVGAGRTKILRAIFGADDYDFGTILVDGQQLDKRSISRSIAIGIGLVPEDRRELGLILNASVAENLGLATMIPTSKFGFVDRKGQRRREEEIAKKLQIRMANINQMTGFLSGGNQQKTVVGK